MKNLDANFTLDPLELRIRNVIRQGSTTPSQIAYSPSLIGDLKKCLTEIRTLAKYDGGEPY